MEKLQDDPHMLGTKNKEHEDKHNVLMIQKNKVGGSKSEPRSHLSLIVEREFSQEVHGNYELKKSAEKCLVSGQCNSGQYHASSIPKIDHDSHSQL
ncbi:hypothetical protein CMV_021601 [Castanea mollissima]|uniref:Uncharacterized protein n=1 Tax=Castanea mollissima TaxID=60419 RepID=A0A8J4QL02_9ROSI|nr:hypothetical protein CMV_021601 [Castanea mollissima]